MTEPTGNRHPRVASTINQAIELANNNEQKELFKVGHGLTYSVEVAFLRVKRRYGVLQLFKRFALGGPYLVLLLV